jgi:hypothetical protein
LAHAIEYCDQARASAASVPGAFLNRRFSPLFSVHLTVDLAFMADEVFVDLRTVSQLLPNPVSVATKTVEMAGEVALKAQTGVLSLIILFLAAIALVAQRGDAPVDVRLYDPMSRP